MNCFYNIINFSLITQLILYEGMVRAEMGDYEGQLKFLKEK